MEFKTRKRKRVPQQIGKYLRWCAVFFFCVFLSLGIPCEAFAENKEKQELLSQLYAGSAVLMDAETGRVLVGKEEETMRPMASTTKIMTCILALEKGDPEELVTASANAVAQPKVHLGMTEGEQFYLNDLLYSLMLESHNDSAVAIAETLAGSVETFAGWMNEKAKEIGCQNTHFVTPNGLDSEDEEGVHSISAADLARIMSYCIWRSPKKEAFLAITQTSDYHFNDVGGTRNFSCSNHNAFLNMMDGAISGKTGFTGKAGYCYVGALQSEGRTFVVALLACGWPNNRNYKWQDTRKLMEYGMANYHYREVDKKEALSDLIVIDGKASGGLFEKAKTGLKIQGKEGAFRILMSEDEMLEKRLEIPEKLFAPVKKGETVGRIVYLLNQREWKSYPVVATGTVEKKTFLWLLRKMCEMFYQFQFQIEDRII